MAFLGTPHQGSSASAIGAFVAWLTTPLFGSNKMLLKSLQWHAAELSNLKESFHNIIKSQEREIKIFSFYETVDTLLLNILPVGLVSSPPLSHHFTTNIYKVVERDSATMDSSEPIAIHKDHSGLNKCIDKEDPVYRCIKRAIEESMSTPRFREYIRHQKLEGQHCPS
jgi:hypothetical protein